jgi:hypothetical protein
MEDPGLAFMQCCTDLPRVIDVYHPVPVAAMDIWWPRGIRAVTLLRIGAGRTDVYPQSHHDPLTLGYPITTHSVCLLLTAELQWHQCHYTRRQWPSILQ